MARHAAPQSVIWSCWTKGTFPRRALRSMRRSAGNRSNKEAADPALATTPREDVAQPWDERQKHTLSLYANLYHPLHPVIVLSLTPVPDEPLRRQFCIDEDRGPAQ